MYLTFPQAQGRPGEPDKFQSIWSSRRHQPEHTNKKYLNIISKTCKYFEGNEMRQGIETELEWKTLVHKMVRKRLLQGHDI